MADVVLVERTGDVATVTLNRPEKLNALNKAMWVRLAAVMRALSGQDEVRCVVLRGAGEKAFSPGADITEFGDERSDIARARAYGALMHDAMGAVGDCPHPTVAVIRGVCVGGGLEVAAMCDLRICSESSRFGVPINRIGVVMAYPEIRALIDLVGRARALEILFEGRVFDAAEARQIGLVNRVVPDEELQSEIEATAHAGSPRVRRWSTGGTRNSRADWANLHHWSRTNSPKASLPLARKISRKATGPSWTSESRDSGVAKLAPAPGHAAGFSTTSATVRTVGPAHRLC